MRVSASLDRSAPGGTPLPRGSARRVVNVGPCLNRSVRTAPAGTRAVRSPVLETPPRAWVATVPLPSNNPG